MNRLRHHAYRRLLPRKNGSDELGKNKRGIISWHLYSVQYHVDINKTGSKVTISVPSKVLDVKLLTPKPWTLAPPRKLA